jgi:uncharacterized surface protein with fasciclin (FAS1) repeats
VGSQHLGRVTCEALAMSDSETPVPPPEPGSTPPPVPEEPGAADPSVWSEPPPSDDPALAPTQVEPAAPAPTPEPEPIFIAEQTPVPPSSDPIVPPTTQLPVTPAEGVPATGEPTAMMPPAAIINPGGPAAPGGPGGPGGPIGPEYGEPEKPWYQKPGPIAVIVIIAALLIWLLIWLLTGDDGSDDDVTVDTTISDTSSTSLLPETTLPPETTVLAETTIPPATTAVPQTTAAPATTAAPTTAAPTTAAPTTAAPTTAAPTTAAPTTTRPPTTTTIPDVIPEPGETLWDVIDRDNDLTSLKQLIEQAGLEDALDDPDATFTLFAPTNEAIEEAFGEVPEDMDEELLQNLLLVHVHDGEAFPEAALLALSEVSVMFGGPQQIDSGASPPTVGGAPILVEAPPAENGILYVVGRVLQPVAD